MTGLKVVYAVSFASMLVLYVLSPLAKGQQRAVVLVLIAAAFVVALVTGVELYGWWS